MLAAAEAAMDAAAEDDAERQRNRARLWAPPVEETQRSRRRRRVPGELPPKPPAGAMTLDSAQSLMAQMAAQDAQLTSRRSG